MLHRSEGGFNWRRFFCSKDHPHTLTHKSATHNIELSPSTLTLYETVLDANKRNGKVQKKAKDCDCDCESSKNQSPNIWK